MWVQLVFAFAPRYLSMKRESGGCSMYIHSPDSDTKSDAEQGVSPVDQEHHDEFDDEL